MDSKFGGPMYFRLLFVLSVVVSSLSFGSWAEEKKNQVPDDWMTRIKVIRENFKMVKWNNTESGSKTEMAVSGENEYGEHEGVVVLHPEHYSMVTAYGTAYKSATPEENQCAENLKKDIRKNSIQLTRLLRDPHFNFKQLTIFIKRVLSSGIEPKLFSRLLSETGFQINDAGNELLLVAVMYEGSDCQVRSEAWTELSAMIPDQK
jgi:hypothetical protein